MNADMFTVIVHGHVYVYVYVYVYCEDSLLWVAKDHKLANSAVFMGRNTIYFTLG